MNKKTRGLTTPKIIQGAYLPAASTVEAALVIPLFMYAALAVIYILQIKAVSVRIQNALYEDAIRLSGYAYVYEQASADEKRTMGEALSVMSAWALLIEELGGTFAKDNYIVGGNAGLVMAFSKVCENDSVIDLQVTYTIKNPFDIFGIGKVTLTQGCKTDGWLGENKDIYTVSEDNEKYVYVTEQGEVYHKDKNCTYLTRVIMRKEKNELNGLCNADGQKYYPCERCSNTSFGSKFIYVTQYGDRYHGDITCTQLARTILKIPVSSVGERTLCVKCGGGND
ncbi:MAG: hypothetical protein Q4F11_04980 [Eubacteriales bacterium]|nr:hypothetical protein [Eubacteriales bacterium]